MGLPIAYDADSACYSYDSQRVGSQFQVEADEMQDFLVSVTIAASKGKSLDQDDLRNQVVSFASRLPKSMRENVEASLKSGDRNGRSNACKMRLVVAEIAQAIGFGTMLELTPISKAKMNPWVQNESILVIPLELKCTSEGWTLTAIIAKTNRDHLVNGELADDSCVRHFPLRDYVINRLDD